MKIISFYQIQKILYNVTFPKIITRIINEGEKINLLCKDKEEMQQLDHLLWTFSQLSFLPHLTEDDEYNERIENLLILTKDPITNLYKKVLVLTSKDLFLNQHMEKYNKAFIITNKSFDKESFINNLNNNFPKIQIKHFIQKLNNSWDKEIV